MKSRGWMRAVLGACVLFVLACAVPAFIATVVAQKAQPKDTKKLDKVQLQEAQALTDALNAAVGGGAAPADIPVKLDTIFFFKALNGQTYVPFTVVIDASQVADPNVAMALRVIKKGATPVPTEKDKKVSLPPAAYQDLEFPVLKVEAGQARISRAFQVPGGDYDVYVAVKEKSPADKKQKAKTTVYRQDLKVPEFSEASGFVTSSVVLADKMEPLPAPLKADELRENPYTIGILQIVPKVGTTFAKTQELGIYFQIYNAGLDNAKKPDVLVEFEFFRKQGDTEKRVFATEPLVLNASTLPKEFDPAKHMLAGPSAWPLASFPASEYRLAVKITDKVTNKTLTHSVSFSVA